MCDVIANGSPDYLHEGYTNNESEESDVIFVQKSVVRLLSVETFSNKMWTSENYPYAILSIIFLVRASDCLIGIVAVHFIFLFQTSISN